MAPRPSQLLTFKYLPNPTDYELLFSIPTSGILNEPWHPLNYAIQRRLAAFDPRAKLHWRVRFTPEQKKLPVVRNWVQRRLRDAFTDALKRGGWQADGTLLTGGIRRTGVPTPLRGVLQLVARPNALTASGDEVREACQKVLDRVEQQVRDGGRPQQRSPAPSRGGGQQAVSRSNMRTMDGTQDRWRSKKRSAAASRLWFPSHQATRSEPCD